jgi:Tol biopolymer transport system component
MTIAAGTRLGPYEILARIGAGGMGEVWKARDPRLGREVAIKVLPASFSSDADRLRRFEQEARAAGVLNHPNITAVHDVGTHEDAPYVVQELLEGETLRAATAGGGLPPRRALEWALQIAHGLAAAHDKGIVHRDLKPENVFVTREGRVKILDFGLAKLTHAEDPAGGQTNLPTATAGTEPGVVLGTLGYMSPEQVRGRGADARSDIFAFGAILYEMLSGRRAFQGDSAADTMSAILKEDPPDLSITNQNVPPGLERIVRHCLEKNPEQRFHSAHDLAFDLEALSGVSAPAAPVAVSERRRGRGRVVPAAAAALALAAIAAAYLVGRRSASAARPAEVSYTQLTFHREPVFRARFAPDGKTVVFSMAPSGSTPQISVLRTDYPGAPETRLAGAHLLAVSSRGELAVITGARYIRHSLFRGTLARMPLQGGAPREIAQDVREADWTPDGSGLAIIRDSAGKDTLEYPPGKILASTGGYFSDLRFSPKGDRIAFFEHPFRYDDRGSLAVVDLAGRKTTLAGEFGAEEGLAWSAARDEVLISAGPSYNTFAIHAVDLAGRRRAALQSAGGLTIHDVAPDGRWIATREDHYRELMVLGPGAERERNLSWLELSYPIAFTRDARTLLMCEESATAGPNYAAVLRPTDGSPFVRLGDGSPGDISRDGKWVLTLIPTAPQHLVLYPTGIGESLKLDPGGIVSYEFGRFFPDGRRVLLCGHEQGRAVRCYAQDVAGGRPRPVTPEGTTNGRVSPDGSQIVVQSSDGGLFLYPAGGGEGLPVKGARADDSVPAWLPDGSLLVATESDMPVRVERLDPQTGRREPFRTLGPADLTGALQLFPIAFSDDGKSYAYSCRRMNSYLFVVSGAK